MTAADVTWYFRWSPEKAWDMTHQRLEWWVNQAVRINKLRADNSDG